MRKTALIHKANCYFRVSDFNKDFYSKVIGPFCRTHLFKHGQITDPVTYQKSWKVTHVFARSNKDKTEYRLPHSMLNDFLKLAENTGYKKSRIIVKEEKVTEGDKLKIEIDKKFSKPREAQVEWIDYQLAPGGLKVNNANTGGGKAQVLSSPIKVPNGWSTMGEMKVGTEVIAKDGTTTKVTGVFPQGITEVLRVNFVDGRFTDVNPEHLWSYALSDDPFKVTTTQQLKDLLSSNSSLELRIPLCQSEKGEDLYFKEEPNTVGFNCGVGLRGVPEEYLNGSTRQRRALLEGLIDGCGLNTNTSSIVLRGALTDEFVSTVKYLAWSLGGVVNHDESKGGLLTVEFKDKGLLIKSIENRSPEPTQCISIEHPERLYVTNDFIVTHNTFMALYTASKLGVRTLITIQPRYITTWLNDIGKTLSVKPEDVVVWEMTNLELLAKNIEDGIINPKIIILPLTRISGYLKSMKAEEGEVPDLGELLDRTGCGFRIIDEGHESFHEVCMSMFYGNPSKTLLLSATLQSDDPVTNKMYQHMIPIKLRLKEPEPENYIDIKAYTYRICPRKYKIKTVQFGSYSDIAFEQSLLKSPALFEFYYQLMKKMFENEYLDIRREGTKGLFFFTLIDMCLKMLEFFRRDFPDIDFETYLGSLDKKNPTKYLEHEVIITTPGSCGTGKDIPGLVTVISPHTVFSTQRNKQMIGRLRRLDGKFNDEITPRFIFPVCSDIPKQRECYVKRKVAFAPKCKEFKLLDSNLGLV